MNRELMNRVRTNFKSHFGEEFIMARASGRINLIGEHVDYNDGFVFPAAIDKGIIVAIGKSNTSECAAIALDFEEHFRFGLESIEAQDQGGWRNYLLGIISELQKRNLPIAPFNMTFSGDIPAGSGLSSSAALENSIVFGLNELFHLGLDRKEMALISQKAEHEFVGVKCGIMDQYASMFGRQDHFLLLDCRSLEAKPYQVDLLDFELVLINTNVQHTLSDSAYNDRRSVCEKVAGMLGKKALRDVSIENLDTIKDQITESEYQKTLYVVQEIQRTQNAAICLDNGDLEGLGKLLFASHEGLGQMYEVSCPELDFLVDMAKENDAVLGARMMGGGFGGCTINLINKKDSQNFIGQVELKYKEEFNVACSVYRVKISEGTQLVN